MVAFPLYISGEVFLVLKGRSLVVMTIFGVIMGLIIRQVVDTIEEPGFLDKDTSNRSPLDPS